MAPGLRIGKPARIPEPRKDRQGRARLTFQFLGQNHFGGFDPSGKSVARRGLAPDRLIEKSHSSRSRLLNPQTRVVIVPLDGVRADLPVIPKKSHLPARLLESRLGEQIFLRLGRRLAETRAPKQS